MKKYFLFCLFLLILNSCDSTLVSTVKAHNAQFINAYELNQMILKKESVLIIDIRQPNMYQGGHIPTAVNIPYYQIDKMTNQYTTAVSLVVYDQDMTKAKTILKKLQYLGYTDSLVLNGGFNSWNYEVRKD